MLLKTSNHLCVHKFTLFIIRTCKDLSISNKAVYPSIVDDNYGNRGLQQYHLSACIAMIGSAECGTLLQIHHFFH